MGREFTTVAIAGLTLMGACSRQPDIDEVPVGSRVQVTREDGALVEGRLTDRTAEAVRVDVGSTTRAVPRREIADFIAANHIDRLVMLSGDAHMVAIDDGTNTDYATSGGAAFPLLHAAALDRPGKVKGGPYSGGLVAGGGQFGVLEVDDRGATLQVTITGRNWRDEILLSHTFTVTPPQV